MEKNGNELDEKNESFFICKKCDFKCFYISNWKRHITTRKHLVSHNGNKMEINGNKFDEKNETSTFSCKICNNKYKSLSGLWKHNKKCNNNISISEETIKNNNLVTPELVMELIKDNREMKQIILEQNITINKLVKNGVITNSNNTNCNNKSFNLNFFLNETCKDAMNIMDFVDSIKLQLSDLENVGEVGYVKGISNIITSNLKALDITQRPIHCTDKKREILYIKDENKWEKEDENKNKLRKVIRKIANKNSKLIQEFKKKYPECIKSTSSISDKYNKIIVEAMGGSGNNDIVKEDKIIKNISNVTILEKVIMN